MSICYVMLLCYAITLCSFDSYELFSDIMQIVLYLLNEACSKSDFGILIIGGAGISTPDKYP